MVLILPLEVLYKIGVLKNFAVFTDSQENTCTRVFLCCNSIEKRLWCRGFLVNFARFLRTALDDCLYLTTVTGYTLQLYIAGNFQLVRSHWGFRFLFSIFFFFFHFLWQVDLFSYARPLLYSYSKQSTILLAQRHLSTMIFTNLKNFNSISNIFQKTHDLLVLRDAVIICIYSRTTDRHFCG